MAKLYNLARMFTATTGTGTITLGAAVPPYLTFALAGAADGDVVSYGIQDGANSEVGTGTYTAAGTTLTRTVTKSTNSNAAISLSGSAQVFITALAEDIPVATAPTAWTPVLTAATPGNLAVAYTTQVGRYIKHGKQVTASFNIVTSTFTYTTATGNLLITGLPFASNSTIGALGGGAVSGWTHAGYTNVAFQVAATQSQLTMEVSGSGVGQGPEAITGFPSASGVVLRGTVVYFTD